MNTRFQPGRAATRVAGCALALALGTGSAAPAFAAGPGPGDTPPTAPPANPDKDYYCKSDPNWYLCQHNHK